MPLNTILWVTATMKVTNEHQNFWYKACNRCDKSTSAALKETFTCNECLSPIAVSTPRCTVQAEVEDSTGALTAYIYGKEVELLLSCTAEDLAHSTSDVGSNFVSATAKSALRNRYLLKIHASQRRFQGAALKKFNVHHAQMIAPAELPVPQKSNLIPNLEPTNLDDKKKATPSTGHQIEELPLTARTLNDDPSCTSQDLASTS